MSDKSKVQWIPLPPDDDEGPPVKILSPKPRQKFAVIVTSDRIYWVLTHWMDGRSRPCVGHLNGCEGCERGLAFRTKGYLSAYLPGEGRSHLAEVTKKSLEADAIDPGKENMRGMKITLSRPSAAKNGALLVKIDGPNAPVEHLPAKLDVMRIMERIWFGPGNR